MAEMLQRIVYDASIDDAVDVSWRLANRTQAFQKQIRQYSVAGSITASLIFLGIWTYLGDIRTLSQFLLLSGGMLACAMIFGRIFRGELKKQIQKQQRKVVLEQFGGKPTTSSEIELRSDAVWVRQLGMEMVFPWNVCTGA